LVKSPFSPAFPNGVSIFHQAATMALSLSSCGKKHRGFPPKLLAAVNLGMGHLGITGGLKKTNGEYLQERYGNF